MITAIWIIAVMEIIRNVVIVAESIMGYGMRKNAYEEFIKSLKADNEEFATTLRDELNKYLEKENE